MKKNTMQIIIIVLLIILILMVFGFGVYYIASEKMDEDLDVTDNNTVEVNDSNTTHEDSKVENIINYEVIGEEPNKNLIINGQKVDITATDFTNFQQIEDILIFSAWSLDFPSIYAVNKEGNIIAYFKGNCVESQKSISNTFQLRGCFRPKVTVSNKTIFITSDNLSQDPQYMSCSKKDSDIVQYKEKINYLGNNQFDSLSLVETTTALQYRQQNNYVCQ